MKIKQHRPNYFTGFEDAEVEINTLEELKEVPFVKNFMESKDFYGLYSDKSTRPDIPDTLIALYNYDEKYGGCKMWWVVGYIFGDANELGLEKWTAFIGDHLDGCPQKTWQHNECTCGFRSK